MSDDLIAAHRDEPKLMPYLHLPFQAGADRILAAMNRKHTAARLSARWSRASAPPAPTWRSRPTSSSASRARRRPSSRPRSTWSSSVGFAQAYSFKYSPRPGTPGAAMARAGAGGRQDRAAASPAGAARRASKRRSIRAASARSCPCCSSARGATRASWSAARPTCKPFTQRRILPCWGASWRLKSPARGPNSLCGRARPASHAGA